MSHRRLPATMDRRRGPVAPDAAAAGPAAPARACAKGTSTDSVSASHPPQHEIRRSRSAAPIPDVRESYLDEQRLRLATTEARNPPSRLVIVDNPGAVTMTSELGESRTFHPNGREESIEIQPPPINVTAS